MSTSLLHDLWQSGQLRTLDHALAQSLRRLDPDTPDGVLAAAALASLAISKGHAGVRLADAHALIEGDVHIAWPPLEAWLAQLAASRWVATPPAPGEAADPRAPLVMEHAPDMPTLLYLRRYREHERSLAQGLQRLATLRPVAGDVDAVRGVFAQLFPPDSAGGSNHQARAAALALRHALLLVTGGPGTGKTTTTARMLVLLAAQAQQAGRPPPRIALAAPTGRAAERMAESVRHAVHALAADGIDPSLLDPLPATGTTLHRLLGPIPDSPRFRHDADNPLPHDVVVVDEASMIDLPLMARLVDAVSNETRLVLLGDPDQLPSVEAGDVLAAVLGATARGDHLAVEEAEAEALGALLGDDAMHSPPAPSPPAARASRFPAARVHLQRGWRQSESLQLAPLAAAVREGDADTALQWLRGGALSGVHFHEGMVDPLQAPDPRLFAHWRALGQAATPADALALSTRLRILTAVREGPQGARTLNARIERQLLQDAGTRATPGHFHGQLLIVTENSYRHGLFNGDIGLCLRDEQGALAAWFPGDTPSQPRAFHPAALPAHESAFAMTVHKAQGSEFDTAWLLLPARSNRVLSRELVYTAITRARRELHVAGSEAVIRESLARHASRWSGLAWRLTAD